MHREQQTAADALEAMFDLLATAASQDASDLVGGHPPRVSLLGNFQRCAFLLSFPGRFVRGFWALRVKVTITFTKALCLMLRSVA